MVSMAMIVYLFCKTCKFNLLVASLWWDQITLFSACTDTDDAVRDVTNRLFSDQELPLLMCAIDNLFFLPHFTVASCLILLLLC